MENSNAALFEFRSEDNGLDNTTSSNWRVLTVEDNAAFLKAFRYSLKHLNILGRKLEVLSANSFQQARDVIRDNPDLALIFIDVVMEEDDAGLQCVQFIREELGMLNVRLILLTGQPGMAPNRQVMRDYDVDDYWLKTDIDDEKIYTILTGNIKTWRYLNELDVARKGMEAIVNASHNISQHRDLDAFSEASLEEAQRLIGVEQGGIMTVRFPEMSFHEPTIVAASGVFEPFQNQPVSRLKQSILRERIEQAMQRKMHAFTDDYSLLYFSHSEPKPAEYLMVVSSDRPLTKADIKLLEVFSTNINTGFARVAFNAELASLAFRDQYTGLFNRNWFYQQLRDSDFSETELVLLELVMLSDIADTFGEAFCRKVILAVYENLLWIKGVEAIAYSGRGQFLMQLSPEQRLDANTLKERVSRTLSIEDIQLRVIIAAVSASINREQLNRVDRLVGQMETHLEQLKEERNNFKRIKLRTEQSYSRRLVTLSRLSDDIDKQQLDVYLQPKLRLSDRQLVGFEALVRWPQPDGTVMAPNGFIPLAEKAGLISELDMLVFRKACKAVKQLENNQISVPVAFNVSGYDLRDEQFATRLLNELEYLEVPAAMLDLEVTETIAMHDYASVSRNLLTLIRKGMAVSIDDFGTGYSSLSHITELAATTLKIDRAFISLLGQAESSRHVVDMILKVAERFGLKVVAEGIESENQTQLLHDMGCEFGQGYLFARPMPIIDALEWAKSR